jgi:hypothetical protein
MQGKHYNIINVFKHFKRVNYKITKVLHGKLNFYNYIKVYKKAYYINALIPFCLS